MRGGFLKSFFHLMRMTSRITLAMHYPRLKKDEYFIICDTVIICIEKDVVKVSFHVSARPDDAAALVLILRNTAGVKGVSVLELYMYTNSGKSVLSGQAAVNMFRNITKKEIIEEFIKNQAELNVLYNADTFNC